MIKEIILIIASLVGIGIALSKRDILFTIITFGLATGAIIYSLGVVTINISFFVAFALIAFLVGLAQKGIPSSNRIVIVLISGLVVVAEIALYQQWDYLSFIQYAMIIPLIIYVSALVGNPKMERGFSCITIIAADAFAILVNSFF
mgnify:FL=1